MIQGSILAGVLLSMVPGNSLDLDGAFLANYSSRVGTSPSGGGPAGEFLLSEERVQLRLQAQSQSGKGDILARADLVHDNLDSDRFLHFREAYGHLGLGWLDLVVGKQVITWGVGDFLFINDFFPKDFSSFYSGRPLDYMKEASTAFRAGYQGPFGHMEIVTTPFFKPNIYPGGDRFILERPFPESTLTSVEAPSPALENSKLAARMGFLLAGWELTAYAYHGFSRQPDITYLTDKPMPLLIASYSRQEAGGLSLQGPLLGGVAAFEVGHQSPTMDRNGSNPSVANPTTRWLAGMKFAPASTLLIGLQYFGEYMHFHHRYLEYLPPGQPRHAEFHHLLTTRLDWADAYQTLRISVFMFLDLTYTQTLALPEAVYKITDDLSLALGARAYRGGTDSRTFGAFGRNSLVFSYITFTY